MSLYPNIKPYTSVEDFIQSLYTRNGVESSSIAWACQNKQHAVIEECIRILLRRNVIPADSNRFSDEESFLALGLNQGIQAVSTNYLFPMRALSSNDPLIIDLCFILRTNIITSVEQFDQLLEASTVRQLYKKLVLQHSSLSSKSIIQICLIECVVSIAAHPYEDFSLWLCPDQPHHQTYCEALSFQPGQIEMLCEAFFRSIVEASIQQRQPQVILYFLRSFVFRHNALSFHHFLDNAHSLDSAHNSSSISSPTSSWINALQSLCNLHVALFSEWSPQQQSEWPFFSQCRQTYLTATEHASLPSTALAAPASVQRMLSASSSTNSPLAAQLSAASTTQQQSSTTTPAATANTTTTTTTSPSNPASVLLQLIPPRHHSYSNRHAQIAPNPLTNIVSMFQTLGEMHWVSSTYAYAQEPAHVLLDIIVPYIPQYVWPVEDRLVIKLISLASEDERVGEYLGEIPQASYMLPQDVQEFVHDREDISAQVAVWLGNDEYLIQKHLTIENRRQIWKLALLYACNINNTLWIDQIVELSKLHKLDKLLSEGLVNVDGTLFAQICNLPHISPQTIQHLLTNHHFKITTNSSLLGAKSNSILRLATKPCVSIIFDALLYECVPPPLSIVDTFAQIAYSAATPSASEKSSTATDTTFALFSPGSFLSQDLPLSILLSTPLSSSPSPSPTPSTSSSSTTSPVASTPSFARVYEDNALQSLYNLLAAISRNKKYCPAISYNDLVVILHLHASQALFCPLLYDFLLTTLMSEQALQLVFKRSTMVNIIDTIYSTPPALIHSLKTMSDDFHIYHLQIIQQQQASASLSQQIDNLIDHSERHRKVVIAAGTSSTSSTSSTADTLSVATTNTADNALLPKSTPALSSTTTATYGAAVSENAPSTSKSTSSLSKNKIRTSIKQQRDNSSLFALPILDYANILAYSRLSTVQLFLNQQTLVFSQLLGLQTYVPTDVTAPLDNAVLFHDVAVVQYLLDLGFVPTSSTMYHLQHNYIFDYRNAVCPDLFSISQLPLQSEIACEVIPKSLQNQLSQQQQSVDIIRQNCSQSSHLSLYQGIPSLFETSPTNANSAANSPLSFPHSPHFAIPHEPFSPTALYQFDLERYETFLAEKSPYVQFKNCLHRYFRAKHAAQQQQSQQQPSSTPPSSLSSPPSPSSSDSSSQQVNIDPRSIHLFLASYSSSQDILRLLLNQNCPIFPIRLLQRAERDTYTQMQQLQQDSIKAANDDPSSKTQPLTSQDLQRSYPSLDVTLLSSRLELLFTFDYHCVQFHQLYQQFQLLPITTDQATLNNVPKIKQEDVLALLLSSKHNGNPLLIYHLTQTAQLYLSIYTGIFLLHRQQQQNNPSTASPAIQPYACIHAALPHFSTQNTTIPFHINVNTTKQAYYQIFARSLQQLLPILADSTIPLQLSRVWSLIGASYSLHFQRLPSSLLLSLAFVPVASLSSTCDLIQSYLYGFGNPTISQLTTGGNILVMLSSLCRGTSLDLSSNAIIFFHSILRVICENSLYSQPITPDNVDAIALSRPVSMCQSESIFASLPPKFSPSKHNNTTMLLPRYNLYRSYYWFKLSTDFCDVLGNTVAMFLVKRKNIDDSILLVLLQLLVIYGEDLTKTNVIGQNVVMLAIAFQRSAEVISFLLSPQQIITVEHSPHSIDDDVLLHTSLPPITTRQYKQVDPNQRDIFDRTIFHYCQNPALVHDQNLFRSDIIQYVTTAQRSHQKATPAASLASPCDVITEHQKRIRFVQALQQSSEIIDYFPTLDPQYNNPQNKSSQSIPVDASVSNSSWTDVCRALASGFSGILDDDERAQRSSELQFVSETHTHQQLQSILQSVPKHSTPAQ